MKLKLLVLTAFSLAGAALTAAPASAGWLFHRHCGVNHCSTTIVCRPYNAFTPVCSGSMVCDGCCPFPFQGMSGGGHCGPGFGNPLLGLSHDPIGLQAMQQPMMMPYPAMAMPQHAMPPQQFQAPMPAPQQTQMPMTYPVHPAAYQQGYYPMYYPVYQQQMMQQQMMQQQMNPYQQAPAYWYGY